MKKAFRYLSLVLVWHPLQSIAQVNVQTGAAEVNIPLYNYSDPGNRLELPANLVYVDGNGLKVSEIAPATGTGWQLDCGGVITRIQRGEPDDQQQRGSYSYTGDFTNYILNYYPNGYLYSEYSPADNIDNGGGYSPYQQSLPFVSGGNGIVSRASYKMAPQYLADREQDIFAFSFNGRSGQFVIAKNHQARVLNDARLKISFTESNLSGSNIRTNISQFTITDESGIQYVFQEMELHYVCMYNDVRVYNNNTGAFDPTPYGTPPTYGSCTACANQYINVIKAKPQNQFVVNKWYLSRIVNPLSGKSIVFNYDTYELDMDGEKIMDYSVSDGHGTVTATVEKHKAKAKRLKSVDLSGSEKLNFVYSAGNRVDIGSEKTLDQLQVLYNNNLVYTWNFGYGYFSGLSQNIKAPTDAFTDQEKQWARLCLRTLQKTGIGGVGEPPYRFDYNLGNGYYPDRIPPMFSIYEDHYGYYNAGTFPWDDVEPAPTGFYNRNYMVSWLQNIAAYKAPYSTTAKNGIISSVTYPLGGKLSFDYEPNYAVSGGQTMQVGGVRVKTTTQYDGIDHNNDIVKQYKYVNADGSSSGWGVDTYTYTLSKSLRAWNCGGDGVPAFSISQFASNYTVNSVKYNLQLTATPALDATISASFEAMAVSMVVSILVQLFAPDYHDFTLQESLGLNQSLHNPIPSGYKRVEVVNMLSADNVGSTVYDLTSPDDHALEVLVLSLPYGDKPRFAPWVYGLPKAITVKDKLGNKVHQTVHQYNFLVSPLIDNNFLSRSWRAVSNEYGCSFLNANGSNSGISQETYYPLTGRTELVSTSEYSFNNAGASNVITTNYQYDNNYQLSYKYVYNSKGEKIETYYYHPYNYPSASGAISRMNDPNINILSPVIASETYINKPGGAYLIDGIIIGYDNFSNGDIKPKTNYAFQGVQPLSGSALAPFNPSNVLRDPGWFHQVSSYGYDNFGNLVQTVTGGNRIISNIYDYDGRLVIASATNASYNDIGYTSFEAEGGKSGSWLNTAAIITTDARTGNKCFNLSDPSNAASGYFGFGGLNSSLTYIVSFWSKNGSVCVNGSQGSTTTVNTCQGSGGWKQGATVNGWTYYEVQVSNVDKIGLSGSGLIDECRVYPVGAQMTTTTWSPLLGKTSECDAAGKVTYYLYDEMGRLVKISDDQRNVIRTYEYNYKQ